MIEFDELYFIFCFILDVIYVKTLFVAMLKLNLLCCIYSTCIIYLHSIMDDEMVSHEITKNPMPGRMTHRLTLDSS